MIKTTTQNHWQHIASFFLINKLKYLTLCLYKSHEFTSTRHYVCSVGSWGGWVHSSVTCLSWWTVWPERDGLSLGAGFLGYRGEILVATEFSEAALCCFLLYWLCILFVFESWVAGEVSSYWWQQSLGIWCVIWSLVVSENAL